MNTSDKIREHFRKYPNAEVAKVVAKFKASKPMVYKLRKQIKDAGWLPELVPVPDLPIQEDDVDQTLNERAQDYGTFRDGAALMQGIKRLLAGHAAKHDKTFADDQWEALEMMVHKIGRIVNGNPDKVDSWVDIAGYATLVADRLQGNAR
jgi:hypothetical protein